MAFVHAATITPTKLEAIRAWLPTQDWAGRTGVDGTRVTPRREDLTILGAFRFDDPAGEVGIETHIVTERPSSAEAGPGRVFQVPLTYRGAPLAGAGEHLVTQMEHSVLGTRWVYDALADPAYLEAVRSSIVTEAPSAVQFRETPEGVSEESTTAQAQGRILEAGAVEVEDLEHRTIVEILRVFGGDAGQEIRQLAGYASTRDVTELRAVGELIATWPGSKEPSTVARLLTERD